MALGRQPRPLKRLKVSSWLNDWLFNKPHLALVQHIPTSFYQPQASRIMIQSCSHKSHPCPHCVFSNRPAPISFHTVIFSHQKFRVYWAFPSREGSSSIWWRSISHFHRASSLSDSPSFPCFILHLISSPRSACGVWRRLGGSERKRTLEDCLAASFPSAEEVRREGLTVGFFPLKITIIVQK